MTDPPVPASSQRGDGRVVTFYSFKGGTGRTMALANVAWILAANGRRVLVADWDLESPGLDRFFQPFLGEHEVREGPGIIDLIRDYERMALKTDPANRAEIIGDLSLVQPYAFSLDWEFPDGSIDFLSPGKLNRDYVAALSGLEWDNFYESLNGGEFLDALRADMKRNYDYVLIDSRTGLSDIADICTLHLPDVLVDCFTLSTQGIEGAARIARDIKQRHKDRGIRLLPVPMRVDQAEKEKVDAGRLVAMRQFPGLPEGMTDAQRREYWASIEVPYQAFYAYEETLAVFGDEPGKPLSLLASFERLTAQITQGAITRLPPLDEQLRKRTMLKFARSAPLAGELIVIESLAEDQAWAEWIGAVLQDAGIAVRQQGLSEEGATPPVTESDALRFTRTLIVVSAGYVARRHRLSLSTVRPDLAVYVTPSSSLGEFSSATATFLVGVPESEALERVRRLLGFTGRSAADAGTASTPARVRYPGNDPQIFEAPARNVRFTGREADLATLRGQLRDYGTGGLVLVALQGLGGIGKTQVALEYTHRFKTDYDLIWWLNCEQPALVDASLTDLGERLRDRFGLGVLASANAAETARQVLDLLSRGGLRWLLVFDNADEIEPILPLLPQGGGQVLVTSRNRAWAENRAYPIQIDLFTTEESVTHLRQRVPSIARAEAVRIGAAVGYLPLAVAAAGAWLAETSYTVSDYLDELERQPHRALSVTTLADHPEPVSKVWDVSLNRLRDRSRAAARLFELCSVMASAISLNLIYSQEMAAVLEPFDAALSEKMVIGRVVQEINRLALINLDSGAGQIVVHELVQDVVRDRMSADELAAARRDVHDILVAARPRRDVDDPETWPRYRAIWPHLPTSGAMTSGEEAVRQLYIDRVRYLGLRGDLERGRELAAEVDACWTAMAKAASTPETLQRQLLQLRFNHGTILRDLGRFAEARDLNEAVLAEQTRLLGEDHPHTLMTAGALAADLRAIGRYREALAMDEKTYPAWTAQYGEDHPRTLLAANNLSVSLQLTGAFAAAMRLNADTHERRRTALGPKHLWTLGSARRIARNLLEAGQYARAVAQIEEVLRTSVEVLGADSREALEAQVLYSIALRSAGRADAAEEPFHAALGALTRRFGGSSSEALACRLSRATNMLSLDRFAEAAADIRQVLAAYERRLGPDHPHTLACWVNLAAALRFTGQYEEALTVIRPAVDGFTAVLGEEHPYTLAARTSAGVLLADASDLDEAERLETSTVEALEHVLGSDHPDTLRSRANLALTRSQRGDHAAAAERAAVIDQIMVLLGDDHPTVVTLREGRRLMRSLDPQPF
jgi:cellulose biosynthesis protein BcsQ/tetratricopeptide (TPR) repeat protein